MRDRDQKLWPGPQEDQGGKPARVGEDVRRVRKVCGLLTPLSPKIFT